MMIAFFTLALFVAGTAWAQVDLGVSAYTWTPDPVVRGGTSTFSINVTNNDVGASANNLSLVVELPSNVDFSAASTPANCAFDLSASPKTLTCTRVSLASQSVWVTTFTGNGLAAGVQTTRAVISAGGNTDPNNGNDELLKNTTVINGANLSVLKSGPANAAAGDVINFTINVSNVNGPDPATTFRVTDNLPAGADFTFQSASGSNWSCPAPAGTTLTCDYSGPSIASGAAAPAITVIGRIITSAGTITNGASAVSTDANTGDPDSTNNGPSQVIVTVAPGTSLRANKTMVSAATGLTTYASGETVNLTLSATNQGPQNASGVSITDVVSADFSVNSLPGGCAGGTGAGPRTIICTVGALNSGVTSSSFLIPLTVIGAAGNSGTNTASVTRSGPSGGVDTPASVNYSISAPFAHLTLVKTKGPNPVAAGGNITNTITVSNSNSSTSAATGTIRVTDVLAANETFASFSGSGWSCSGVAVGATGTMVCDYAGANLARGASLPALTIITQASAGYLGPISNTACTGQAAGSPHVPADNSSTGNCDTRTVTGSNRIVDLSVSKSASIAAPTHVLTSDNSLVYTLTVANAGPDVAPTVSVVDPIPGWYSGSAGTTGGSAIITGIAAGESCSFGSTINCTLLNLANAALRTITITLNRPFGDGSFTNTATVSSPDAIDINGGDNISSASIIVDPMADVAVTGMAGAPNPVKVGVPLTYTTSIKNNGPSTGANVVLRQRINLAAWLPGNRRMNFVAGSAVIAGTSATCTFLTFSGAPYAGDEGVECTGFSLANNESRQLIFSVIPVFPYPDALDAPFTSNATISTTTVESDAPGYANNTNTNTITVTTKALDLTVTDNDPGFDPAPFGDPIVYAVSVQNNGPSQATGFKLTVTPTVPPQGGQAAPYTMIFNPAAPTSLPAGATCGVVGSDVVCYLAASQAGSVLSSGSSKAFNLRFDTGPISNTPVGSITFKTTAVVESYETGTAPFAGDSLAGNNSVTETTTVLPKTDLQVISKSVSPASPFSLNQPFTYTVVVANMGPSPAAGVRVTDILPSGLSLNGSVTAAIGSGSLTTNSCTTSGVAFTGITVTCDLGTLPVASGAGDAPNLVTISIPVRAMRGTYLSGHGFNTNRANTASIAPLTVAGVPLSYDPTPGNNISNTVNVQIEKSSIAGSVYSDNNSNNAMDGGEKIATAVTFGLYGVDAWGNAVGTAGIPITVTSSGGDFLFDNLPTADASGYTIVETQPAGYYDRFEVLGTWAGAVLPNTGVKPVDTCNGVANCSSLAAHNTISAIKLPQNTAATGYLFQEYRQATVAGHVYRDLNNDGNRSGAGETDISGVQVKISGTTFWGADLCTFLGAACTQTTTGTGYSFAVPPSDATSYTVAEQSLPASFYDGKDQNGTGLPNVIVNSDNRAAPENIVVGVVNPNVSLTERNFGELPYASISGSVFVDSNSNALKDGGETGGVPGVTITLSGTDYLARNVCTVLGSCTFTTDASGNYSITGLPPGTYSLSEALPPGMTHTGSQAGSAGGTGGAGIGVTTITAITIGAGVGATGYNFGEFGQALTGFVYADLNRNGVKDAGEPGIAGVSMTLSGTTTGGVNVCSAIAPNPCTVTTAAGGGYSFVSLPASNAAGYTVTQQSQAAIPLGNYQDGAETVGSVNGVTTGSAAVNDRISGIVIAVGQAGNNYNFGELAGSLAGRVYLDADDNGSFNGSDTGISGVAMMLSGTTASNVNVCTVVSSCTVNTAADGSFSFVGVPASNGAGYTLSESQPVDYADRATTAGSLGAASTTGTAATGIVLNPGIDATGYLFGEKVGTLSGSVFLDANNNGIKENGESPIAGVVLALSGLTASGTNVCTTIPSCTTTTLADGSYTFSGLRNADAAGYAITESQPAAYIDGKHSKGLVNGAAAGCGNPSCNIGVTNVISAIPFNATSTFTQFNFGEMTTASIDGRVYHDANNNSSYDPGEELGGVTLTLSGTDDQGTVLSPVVAVTASNGTYRFMNLRPSNGSGYTITETQPAGIGDYPAATGTQSGTISGASVGSAAPNVISMIVLPQGSNGINYDFRENASGISGFVYLDSNDNGIKEAGEIGIAGVVLTLTGGSVPVTTASAADGSYRFVGLPAGVYTVTESQPNGYLDGREKAGGFGGTVDNVNFTAAAPQNRISSITLPLAAIASDNNFGELAYPIVTASIAGKVFLDQNNNGMPDANDAGIAGVILDLTGYSYGPNGVDNGGAGDDVAVSAVTTTDLNGNYLFANLAPGKYNVTEPTQPTASANGITSSGVVTNGGVVGTATNVATLPSRIGGIVLPENSSSVFNNFAEIPVGRNISGRVFLDHDNNGVMNGSDHGVGGQIVNLTGTDSGGNSVTRSVTTLPDGSYNFSGLPEGVYTITQPVQPPSTNSGITTAGSAGGAATAVAIVPSAIASIRLVGSMLMSSENNFAEVPIAAPDLAIAKTHSPAVFTQASSNGYYTITPSNVGTVATSGTITIVDTLPAGITVAAPPTGRDWNCVGTVGASVVTCSSTSVIAAGSTGNSVTLRVAVAAALAGQERSNVATISGGGEPPGLDSNNTAIDQTTISSSAAVQGHVWLDLSHTRKFADPLSIPLAGWIVELLLNGNQIATATTDASGAYAFTGLPPASGYQIRFRNSSTGMVYGNAVPNEDPISRSYVSGVASPNNPAAAVTTDGTLSNLTLLAGTTIVEQSLPFDPAGVVYDAVTRQPVAGAVVTISGPVGFSPESHVVGGNTSMTTGSDGLYQFLLNPTAPSGIYTLTITTYPVGYVPSSSSIIPVCAGTLAVGAVPNPALVQSSNVAPPQAVAIHSPTACPGIVAGGSSTTQYFSSFSFTPSVSANLVNNHIPLDPVLGGGIVMSKSTPMTTISKGGLVPYTITATNTLSGVVSNVNVVDRIPPGFRYRLGSASLNGVMLEPLVTGRDMVWTNQSFAAGERKTYRMVLVVGAGVGEGEYVNQVWSMNNLVNSLVSNIATATVRVIPDPTFDCSDIIGKVFDDKNANGYQDDSEPGIPNVRVVTARGLLVTTDAEGRFHVACAVIPQADHGSNFVMKLDERTLPSGYRLTTENPRDVRVTRGKMVKLNFGATVHRVVRLELTAAAFAKGTELAPQWTGKLDTVLAQLKSRPSVLRIAYANGGDQAQARLDAVAVQIREMWKKLEKQKEAAYPLVIETGLEGAK